MTIVPRAAILVVFACIVALSPFRTACAKDRLEREWAIASQPNKLKARLLDGTVGVVRLSPSDGSIISVKFDELGEGDQKYVKAELGLDVIDMTGVWRSESGTYYAMTEGRGGKVYVRMIDSPHMASVEGSLRHKDGRVVSDQWLTVFKTDPSATTRSGASEYFLTPDNEVRVKYDYFYWDQNGKENKKLRKKVTNSFVRLDHEEIPDRIIARYFPTPKSLAEKRKAVIQKIVLWWFARTAAKSFDPRENLGIAIIHVALMHASDSSLKSALRDLFPDLDEAQVELLVKVVEIWLDRPSDKELKEDALKALIADAIKTNTPELAEAAGIVEFIYDVHRARRNGVD